MQRLESISHAEGRVYNVNVNVSSTELLRVEYAIRDHLGNNRLTFTDKNNDGKVDVNNLSTNEILSDLSGETLVKTESHYYPFGFTYEGPTWMNDAADNDNRYKYNACPPKWNEGGARNTRPIMA
ncbi:MAG: hypothetical protein IPL46_10100 [Saprospiraceae bacterium]|nr:hypothetical protein [Saprospiraceae bacterium]